MLYIYLLVFTMSKSDNLSNHKKLDHKYKITNSTFSKIMKKI